MVSDEIEPVAVFCRRPTLYGEKLTPLGKSGSPIFLEVLSTLEVAFAVEAYPRARPDGWLWVEP